VLPEVAVRSEADAGRLAILPWNGPFSVHMQMAWHARRWISPAMAALLETARETFAQPTA
jgi:DNA-binding transcriptional LysR family regulator